MSKNYNPVINGINARKAHDRELTDIAIQMAFDAATLAAHDVFKMGEGRFPAFSEAFRTRLYEILKLINSEAGKPPSRNAENDPTLEVTTTKVDEALKAIVGEKHFNTWDERYNQHFKKE